MWSTPADVLIDCLMTDEAKKRLKWIELYEQYGVAGIVCLKAGISRPTLRKWLRRYEQEGLDGLESQSKRPHSTPRKKVFETEASIILGLRKKRGLGARRIQSELRGHSDIQLSLATIHKVLDRAGVKPLVVKRINRKSCKRYSRPIPGDRVQMDVCKIGPGLYQYTAIDDCSRFKVLGLYPRRSAKATLSFLERVVEEMPFSIQRIQTDRGREFLADKVQKKLMQWAIKFRPIKPRSPHLNGKVERSQRTDLEEFYPTVDLKDEQLQLKVEEWQFYYNWHRPHSSLKGKTPIERISELTMKTPTNDEVEAMYEPSKERLREQNYKLDLLCSKLKLSV